MLGSPTKTGLRGGFSSFYFAYFAPALGTGDISQIPRVPRAGLGVGGQFKQMSLDTGMWSVAQGAGEEGKEIAGLERVKLYFEGLNLHYSARLRARTPAILSRGSSSVSSRVNSCSGSCHPTSLGFDAFLLSYSVFCLHLVHSPVFSLKKANQCVCVHICSRVCRCMCASVCVWRPGDSLGCWPLGIVHCHFEMGSLTGLGITK